MKGLHKATTDCAVAGGHGLWHQELRVNKSHVAQKNQVLLQW